MKIGIDAKWFFSGPVSGRVVLQNLLEELVTKYTDVEWWLFFDKDDADKPLPTFLQKTKRIYVWSKINMLSNLFLLPRHINNLNLDAFLFQTFAPVVKCKSLVFIHDILYEDYPQFFSSTEKLYFRFVRPTLKNADRIITTTEFVKTDLIQHKYCPDESRINIVPLGVHKRFAPIEKHDVRMAEIVKSKFALPEKYILFVGRLNVRKNINSLLMAIQLMKNKLTLVIAGDKDWKTPNLQSLLENPAIREKVHFVSKSTDEELALIYAQATLFCYPSFAEGFGLPPLEAMASGVPVVVSHNTAIPEVCGTAATYTSEKDPTAIAAAIDMLLEDEQLYREKRAAGLERASHFSWERSAQNLMQSMLDLVEKKD